MLLCIARPLTVCAFDVGVESHDRLYRNPFACILAPHELKPDVATPLEGRAVNGGTRMDHHHDYPPGYLTAILKEVKTIAMVGASPDPTT